VDSCADPRIQAYGMLLEAHAAVADLVRRELEAAAGISAPEFEVILRLARTPGEHLRMTDLAEQVGLTTSGTTRLVDRVEAMGLAKRQACPTDRRSFEVYLTAKGRRLLDRVLPVHLESLERHVAAPLGGDLAALEAPMRKLRDAARRR
jgi:MarR family transcriptional regulator, 2-MHQ and catechol-resistance regulon repressor